MRLANGGIFPLFLAEESAFVGGEKNDGNFLFSAEIPCIIASERGKQKSSLWICVPPLSLSTCEIKKVFSLSGEGGRSVHAALNSNPARFFSNRTLLPDLSIT